MNERIKELRSIVGLSQREFGERIGIVKTAVSKIEKGENSPREQTILSICREFNVNYAWLKEGLDELDKKIVKSYMQLTEEKRKVIKEYLHDIFISE